MKAVRKKSLDCQIIYGDSRSVLPPLGQIADLIVTSPPYADARKKHYDSIHPDAFVDWFSSFHQAFFDILPPTLKPQLELQKLEG